MDGRRPCEGVSSAEGCSAGVAAELGLWGGTVRSDWPGRSAEVPSERPLTNDLGFSVCASWCFDRRPGAWQHTLLGGAPLSQALPSVSSLPPAPPGRFAAELWLSMPPTIPPPHHHVEVASSRHAMQGSADGTMAAPLRQDSDSPRSQIASGHAQHFLQVGARRGDTRGANMCAGLSGPFVGASSSSIGNRRLDMPCGLWVACAA